MEFINAQAGTSPLLISVPHAGTMIPAEIKDRMQPETLFLPDTDWFVDKLYGWAPAVGASIITTPWSRYVIDLNRPPDDEPLYDRPGTSLVPTSTFCGMELYRDGEAPGEIEIRDRLERFWKPYHQRLAEMLESIRANYGYALLLDGHTYPWRVLGRGKRRPDPGPRRAHDAAEKTAPRRRFPAAR
jgi:N-formylglutamate amidohydrolase